MKYYVMILLIIFLCSCDEKGVIEDETYQYGYSDIQESPVLIPTSDRISGLFPLDGQGMTKSDEIKFSWQKEEDYKFYTLVFLNELPVWRANNESGFTDLQSKCIGGVSHLAGDVFTSSVTLSPDLKFTEVGVCDADTQNGLISAFASRSNQDFLRLADEPFDGSESVYWVVLGYNSKYQLVGSSSVQEIVLEE